MDLHVVRRIRQRHLDNVPYREARSEYRQFRRAWVQEKVQHAAEGKNLFLTTGLGLGGALLFFCWGALHDMQVDVSGLIVAGVAPPLLVFTSIYLLARKRVPIMAFGEYKRRSDELNPAMPWISRIELRPDARIYMRLMPKDGRQQETTSVGCTIHLSDGPCGVREPMTDQRIIDKDDPVEFVYPDDFHAPVFPLPSGGYRVAWSIQYEVVCRMGVSNGIEDELTVP